jgi:hypothetical protein
MRNWFNWGGDDDSTQRREVAEEALEAAREKYEEVSQDTELTDVTERLKEYQRANHFAENMEAMLAAAIRRRRVQ